MPPFCRKRSSRVIESLRLQSIVIRALIVATVFLVDGGSCEAKNAELKGIRARLYWVNTNVTPEKRLVPNQSPNLDTTIHAFKIAGGEQWFTSEGKTYTRQYVLVLEAELKIERGEEFEVQLTSEAPASLMIDGEELLFADEGDPEVDDFEAESDSLQLKVVQYVNSEPSMLEVRWRFDDDEEFEAIPVEVLKAPNFYFRPTNGSAKRQEDAGDRPGKFQKVAGLYPGLDITTIRPPEVEVPVGGLDLLPDGRLVVAVFDARRLRAPVPQEQPDGELWLYNNPQAVDPRSLSREMIAENLYEPCGVCVVGESIFVSQRDEVTRFDFDSKQQRWQPTTVATGWESNDFHALSFGLIHQPGGDDHPGYLLMARGTGLGLKQNPPNHGAVWRIDLSKPPGENVEPITGGHRTPNGIGIGPKGEVFVTDNQGEYTPANELNHIIPGQFYGFEQRTRAGGEASPFQDRDTTHAAVILPQDEIANSPSEPLLIPDGWPFVGQMLVGDVKYGGINRVMLEQINGKWQGAAFRFTQGLEAGVNRMAFDSHGHLYAGGIGGDHSSTWHWVDPKGNKTYQGLQRLTPNGIEVFDLQQVEITKAGFRVSFTKSISANWLNDINNYRLTQWRYEATPNYGGPKVGEQELYVTAAVASDDCRSVELTVEGRNVGHVVHLVTDPSLSDGSRLWSTEAWYTVWEIPQ